MWRWYREKADEVLADLDSAHAVHRAMQRFAGIPVQDWALFPSEAPGHAHLVLRLTDSFPPHERIAMALRLGSDAQRAAQDLMRIMRGTVPILATRKAWPDFWRDPDGVCECLDKHTDESVHRCSVMRAYRGGGGRLRPFPLDVIPYGVHRRGDT